MITLESGNSYPLLIYFGILPVEIEFVNNILGMELSVNISVRCILELKTEIKMRILRLKPVARRKKFVSTQIQGAFFQLKRLFALNYFRTENLYFLFGRTPNQQSHLCILPKA